MTKRMMAKKVEPNTFKPPCHKLREDTEAKLEELLKEYKTQFTQDENIIGTIPLRKMTIDTGDSDPVSQKPYPIVMKHYKLGKDEISKHLSAKVIKEADPFGQHPSSWYQKEMEENIQSSTIVHLTKSHENLSGLCWR